MTTTRQAPPRAVFTTTTVTGSKDRLTTYLSDLADRGALVSMTIPELLVDGRYRLAVCTRATTTAGHTRPAPAPATTVAPRRPAPIHPAPVPAPARKPRRDRFSLVLIAVNITLAAAVLALVGSLVAHLVGWTLHALTHNGPMLLGITVTLAAILAATGARAVVHHCPGCRH